MATHTQAVQRLYRQALRVSRDWAVFTELWRPMALTIRQEFEVNRHVKDPVAIARLLAQTEQRLEDQRHPDPYRRPEAPEGSKWERNTPPRHDIHFGDFASPSH